MTAFQTVSSSYYVLETLRIEQSARRIKPWSRSTWRHQPLKFSTATCSESSGGRHWSPTQPRTWRLTWCRKLIFFSPCHKQGRGGVHGCAILKDRKNSPAPSVGWVCDIQGWDSANQELPKANAVLLGCLPLPIPPIKIFEHILRKEINAHP